MTHWMFRCRDVSWKISQSMDVKVTFGQRLAVRLHLMMCRHCSLFYRQVVALRQMSCVAEPDASNGHSFEPLSEETKNRIKEKIRSSCGPPSVFPPANTTRHR